MQPRFGIRTKLLLSILAILLLSYSTLLYSTMNTLSASLHNESQRSLEANLKFARSQFSDRSDIVKYTLLQSSLSNTLQAHLAGREKGALVVRLNKWHTVLPFLDLMVVLDRNKRILARMDGKAAGQTVEFPGVVDQAMAAKKVITSTELIPAPLLCRAGVTGFCGGARAGGEAMVVTVTVPILDQSGQVLGCVVTGDIMNRHPNLPTELKDVFGSDVVVTITQRGMRIASSLPQSQASSYHLDARVMDSLERGEIFRGDTTIDGIQYETAVDPLLNSRGEFVGSLGVAVSMERFRKLRQESLDNIMASAILGIIASFGLAFIASRKLTGPLRELAAKARRIERGDFDQRVEETQSDEVGVLATSFNTMAQALRDRDRIINRKTGDLQDLNEQLEKKVTDRTSALTMEMGRLEAVLTSLAEGVVVTDRDNHVVLYNPAAQEMFGLVPHRVIGQAIERVCQLGGFEGLIGRIRELRDPEAWGGSSVDMSVRGKPFKIYLCSLNDEQEEFGGIVVSMRDVSVEQQVDRMKTDFISTVSHELKTPLTSMKGSLQLLLNRGKWLTDTERQLLTVCFRNTQRLIRLISDILDISGIESGGMLFTFRPLALGEVAVYAVEEIKSYAMSRGITIVNTVGEHLPHVYGDSDRLIQVMTNLLSNAVKFSPDGKVVMVTAEREGNYVVVSVADRGKVIEPNDRDKLFKKFQQIRGTERQKGGTGLGLAICKEIVDRHHGRIFYTAAKEYGNTFSFTVPVMGETDGQG
ncbi:ATP-binding protein [Geomonas sp. Red32]|uniref:ATP-binding protein n=1 Tax=Geomonas sp. Red32 TaxID=2912856 RepID=UPI00202CB82A|nr:ATP-binding protein [Geomonas sp. Red32]MCM0080823.1 ATP-binding protein [Geomonas sp. Red32]